MKKASKTETAELIKFIDTWMTEHPSFDNKSTLIQIAIAEFLLNRQNKTLFAQVAQLVEQRTENPRVSGSIPLLSTIDLEMI